MSNIKPLRLTSGQATGLQGIAVGGAEIDDLGGARFGE
jgi:hypothetical protein